MDLYNIFTKIPYIIMLGVGLTLVLQIYVGSLETISQDIDEDAAFVYDAVIATEQMQNLGERRSFVDIGHIGTGSGYDCQITEIEDLDDEYLTYRTQSEVDLDCAGISQDLDHFQSRVLILDDEEYPASIEVYED